jgi:hypothetical protein
MGIRGMVPQTERLARELVSEIQTTPPTGAVQLAPTPGLLEKSDIGFYSQLEAAVQPLQNKGTGQQYLAQIQKSAGVKPEEIQWTGLDEFLKSKQSVTKQEIQDYLQANRVDVQEVQLGGTMQEVGINPDSPYAIPEVLDVFQREADAGEGFRVSLANDYDAYMALERNFPDLLEQDEWADIVADSLFPNRQDVRPTKFSSYTLPGGENYREILLTLPPTKAINSRLKEIDAELNDPGTSLQRRQDLMLEREEIELDARDNDQMLYRTSHFDQPNILAHLRVNDRTVDGKKTLFVEEIQSDWHQAGRKKGYATGKPTFGVRLSMNGTRVNADGQAVFTTREEAQALADRTASAPSFMAAEVYEIPPAGVPDAPFKTSWHELSLKRAIQEAAEKGYDQIAFTTGKTQAERYDLSKQVDSLLYTKNPDGTYRVSAQVQGQGRMLGESIPESNLEDYVGKEVAAKMAKGAGDQIEVAGDYDPVSMTSSRSYMTELSGEGLKVGGEGMKGFYDNILPKSLDKLGKKFGAKVGKTDMDGVEVWQMDITPQMRESVVTKGQPLFAIPAIGAGLLGAGMMQEEETY